MAAKLSSHHTFEQKGPLEKGPFITRLCDQIHGKPAENRHSGPLCGTDHYCLTDFHFEVENNSLQTFHPAR
jgi:hypothetical protein